jgi:hypothetical protein
MDLWKWKMKKSQEVNIWLMKNIYEKKNKTFRDLDNLPDIEQIFDEGSILLKEENAEINKILKDKYVVEFEGYKVGVVDSNKYTSKLGNLLAKEYKFGIVRGTNPKNNNIYLYGLRSIGNFDVSEIARKYGGNGHKNASGFELLKNKEIWKII